MLYIINFILLVIFLYLMVWNAWFLLVNKGAPNIKTAPAIRKKILELLDKDMAEKSTIIDAGGERDETPYTIIDPGCGNGNQAVEIAKAFPKARVIGLEVSPVAMLRCKLNKKLAGVGNVEFIKTDMFDYDYAQADAIIMFQHTYFMERMGQAFKDKARPGTLITSNKFPLGAGWEPVEVLDIDTLMPHQKTLHVYHA